MSFLDKALKAATAAKTQIDEVREMRAATSVKPVAAAPLTDHEEDVVERARSLGAPDPYVLLTAAEASDAAGQVLGGPSLTYGDDTLGVKFEASGKGGQHWRVAVSAFHAIDHETPFDAGAHWFGYLADVLADDGAPVDGLGDAAILRDNDLLVLADPAILMFEVSTPHDDDRARMVGLARQVLARLS